MDPVRVKGFLDEAEGLRLYDIALSASKMGPCLEIGSYCGKSAVYIGAACRTNGGTLKLAPGGPETRCAQTVRAADPPRRLSGTKTHR
ncbi:conserved uncharacterized protein [Desulfococcus multivorans]|nr:conserved uncharacterized protein [Desulfococcus multivorans]